MMNVARSLTGEKLPISVKSQAVSDYLDKSSNEDLETRLIEQLQAGNRHLLFPLGQFYFELGQYDKSRHYFEVAISSLNDWQAMFQLGVMLYDGIGCEQDMKAGFEYMLRVATSSATRARHLVHAAQFNVGRAYYQGCGVTRSDADAERYWLLAADDGNPEASVKAQSTLGLFYSSPGNLNLKKSFHWHSEACGNGNLESQGALGVMYLEGLGVRKDLDSAFECLRDASDRGNVYAMGHLVAYYYQRKLFTKAVELASFVSQYEDVAQIAVDTECMELYIRKGISLACFYYARCLSTGRGVKANEAESKKYYSRSFHFDQDTCAQLQKMVQHGKI